jgi:hypothetical protein
MNFSRLGFLLVAFGAAFFVLDYYEITIPLKLALIYFGGLVVFGGGLFTAIGAIQRWRTPNARFIPLVDAGWTTVSFGLLVSIGSYLALTQTVCEKGCNLVDYNVSMYAGLVLAAAGLGVIVYWRLSRR